MPGYTGYHTNTEEQLERDDYYGRGRGSYCFHRGSLQALSDRVCPGSHQGVEAYDNPGAREASGPSSIREGAGAGSKPEPKPDPPPLVKELATRASRTSDAGRGSASGAIVSRGWSRPRAGRYDTIRNRERPKPVCTL